MREVLAALASWYLPPAGQHRRMVGCPTSYAHCPPTAAPIPARNESTSSGCAGRPSPCWGRAPLQWTMPRWRSNTAPTCISSCARRAKVVNRHRWLTFAGFLKHIGEMPDEWRWRIMGNILTAREGFPTDTYKRVAALSELHHATQSRLDRYRAWRIRIHRDDAQGPLSGPARDLRHRHSPGPGAASRARRLRRQDRAVEGPLHAAAGRGRLPARGLSLSRPGLCPAGNASRARAPWLSDIHVFGIGAT